MVSLLRETWGSAMPNEIAWISLVIRPVLLLVLFQLQFLPFHNEWISWEQRLVVADLALLWFLRPSVARRAGTFRARGHVLRARYGSACSRWSAC